LGMPSNNRREDRPEALHRDVYLAESPLTS